MLYVPLTADALSIVSVCTPEALFIDQFIQVSFGSRKTCKPIPAQLSLGTNLPILKNGSVGSLMLAMKVYGSAMGSIGFSVVTSKMFMTAWQSTIVIV